MEDGQESGDKAMVEPHSLNANKLALCSCQPQQRAAFLSYADEDLVDAAQVLDQVIEDSDME